MTTASYWPWLNGWGALECLPRPLAVAGVWEQLLGEFFPAFQVLCLEATERLGSWVPCRVCGCDHKVEPQTDGSLLAVSRPDRHSCPPFRVLPAELVGLEVNLSKLGRGVCGALGLSPSFCVLPFHNTVQIGLCPPNTLPVILTLQVYRGSFRAVAAELVSMLGTPFVLLAPTSGFFDARCQMLLQRVNALFLPLDATLSLHPDGTLTANRPPAELFARFNPQTKPLAPNFVQETFAALAEGPKVLPGSRVGGSEQRGGAGGGVVIPGSVYALRKGLGVWHLTFAGQEAELKHERGLLYVAYLLLYPPAEPLHALDLIARVPALYRRQLGLTELVDPATGKVSPLEVGSRLQERSLALDDAQTLRAILRRERELEAVLDDGSESEPVKAEALRELEALPQFQQQYGRRTRENAERAADAVRKAIRRLHRHLERATDASGRPNPVLAEFAVHLEKYLLAPSRRYATAGNAAARSGLAGCLTYERPPGIVWNG